MLTGQLRSQIDRIWDAFWSGGISNCHRSGRTSQPRSGQTRPAEWADLIVA